MKTLLSLLLAAATLCHAAEITKTTQLLVARGVTGATLHPGADVEVLAEVGASLKVRYKSADVTIEGVIPKTAIDAAQAAVEAPDVQGRILSATVYKGVPASPKAAASAPRTAEDIRNRQKLTQGATLPSTQQQQAMCLDLKAAAKFKAERTKPPYFRISTLFEMPDTTRQKHRGIYSTYGQGEADASKFERTEANRVRLSLSASGTPGRFTGRFAGMRPQVPAGKMIAWRVEMVHEQTVLDTKSFPDAATMARAKIEPNW